MSDRSDRSTSVAEAWLSGGGELGALIREHDWSQTPLGPIESWPQSLKTTLGILLNSRYPMFVFWGPHLVKIYNDAYRPITGRKHPWALGRPGPEVWPEIWSDIKPLVDRALSGNPTWSDDLLLFMERNGFPEEVYFTFSYSPVADESGGIGGMFCACTETTSEVLGERRLRTLRDIATSAVDARNIEDACTRFVAAIRENPEDVPFALVYLAEPDGSFRLYGSSGVEPDHSAALERIDADDGSLWPLGVAANTRTSQLVSSLAERTPMVPVGPWPEPPSTALVVPLLDGALNVGIGAVVVGLSARRPFDDDYREWCTLVASQLSASVSNARAAEAQRLRAEALAELDRAKTKFFSNVSHEFRTPLTLMLGPLQDVLGSPDALSPDDRRRLEVAHRNTLRLLKLVNSLLDFSRVEAGRIEVSYQETDIATLTAELAGLFRSAVESAGLELVVDCQPTREPVFVDRAMWEHIVLNLLSNALKFTFRGRIAVTLEQADSSAMLQVADTGVGIAPEEVPHVFERFHQVRNAGGRSLEGTGIGLALVQELVRLHGGSIAVRSEPGHGSTFTVTIPAGSAHLPPDRIRTPSSPAFPAHRGEAFVQEALRWLPAEATPAARAHGARNGRILVADDNADMRDYLRHVLEDRYDVESVGDGVAAIEAIRQRPPDIVLADVMMPGLDGFDVLAAIRRDPSTRDLPVVLLSARAGEEARTEGLRAGADDYLVKPFAARELVARIDSTLELARIRRHGDERLGSLNRELARRVLEQQTLLDVLPIGIGIANDRECRDIRVNRAFAAVLGISPRDNASKTALDEERPTNFQVLTPDGVEVPDAHLPMQVAAREGRIVTDVELDVVHEDGRVIRLLEYAAPLYDEHGAPRGAVGAFVDITDRKQAEDALRRSHRDLEDANRLKDEFLATLSHELRTPLNAVLGWAQMLRTGSLKPSTTERALDSLERNARAQAQLVDDLLDVSRIMAGKLHLKTEPVNLATIVTNAVETVRSGIAAKQLNLDIHIEDRERLLVTGDPDRLQQIVWNLVANAVKFTPAGGRIHVEVRPIDGEVELAVRDTGQGIAPAFLPYVFERFRQMDGSTVRRHGGLGLGLSIVKHLTEVHGGAVRAESPGPDQGATFVVRLPRRPPAAPEERALLTRPARGVHSLSGIRALVVDDEADARELLQHVLEANGADVVTASSAGEALKLVQEEPIDVLIADIAMPERDGYSLIREIRQLAADALNRMPAVAVTAFASTRARNEALDAGFNWHVSKPIDPDALVATIFAALAR